MKYKERNWDKSHILPTHSGPKFEAIKTKLKKDVAKFESIKKELPNFTKDDVVKALKLGEKLSDTASRIGSYAQMLFSENTQLPKSKAFMDDVQKFLTDNHNKMIFFSHWWKNLPASRVKELMPENEDYRYHLTEVRKMKQYTLGLKVEQAINIKDITGASAWVKHYDLVTNGFTYTLVIDGKILKERGKPKEFTQEALFSFVYDSDPKKREAAYKSLMSKFNEHSKVLGDIYKNIVTDWKNELIDLRKYKSPISARNIGNDISDEAVDTLLSVCRENNNIFQYFFKKKAKLLNMNKMKRYHIYAPLKKSEKKFSYPYAVDLVLKTFYEFDERFGDLAKRIFDENHVNSQKIKGKQSGAYCMSITPDITPYLLLNYEGKINDVSTTAHESGHGIHDQLAAAKHSMLTFEAPLVLAETASTFGEMVLFDKIMEQEKDDQVKKDLLIDKISHMYATIQRQAYFTIFEKLAHKKLADSATTDDLSKIYYSTLKEHFGNAVKVPEEFKSEWMYIPHMFHTPFYCYSYSFGELLTLSLYDMYKKDNSFKKDYLKILEYGGSKKPEDVLNEVGINVKSPKFWRDGYGIVKGMVNRLEKM